MASIRKQRQALQASAAASVAQLRDQLAPGDLTARRAAANAQRHEERANAARREFDRIVVERRAADAAASELDAQERQEAAEAAALAAMRRFLSE